MPLLLQWMTPGGLDWARLSEISQTYAAISVPLTAAALLGAVASLRHQARQIQISHSEAKNAQHSTLLAAAQEDPDLMACWGPLSIRLTALRWRQFIYINQILNFWHTEYLLSSKQDMDAIIQSSAHRLFRGEIGCAFWILLGVGWKNSMSGGPRSLRFAKVLDAAFEAAQAEGPPEPTSNFFLPDGGD
ncbi:DUF6082 family protein [Streptomyces lincolnensis]|uniref:DUF6082 family protein n=1 Tax=Streptomyces lincolnensis TaxID=1915 RepID=UPI0037D5AB66